MKDDALARIQGHLHGLEAVLVAIARHMPTQAFLTDVAQELDAQRAALVALSRGDAALDELSAFSMRIQERLASRL